MMPFLVSTSSSHGTGRQSPSWQQLCGYQEWGVSGAADQYQRRGQQTFSGTAGAAGAEMQRRPPARPQTRYAAFDP
jgi:hypothetical protein